MTSNTDYIHQKEVIVPAFITHSKPQHLTTNIIYRIPAYSDDDSACSYDSSEEEDPRLMTPPLLTPQHEEAVTQHQLINSKREEELIKKHHTVIHETDWGKTNKQNKNSFNL